VTEFFLSHAGADKALVRRLGVELQVAGGDVFFDEWTIGVGESISGAIEDGLRRCDVFVLAWTAAAEASAWARREYQAAIKLVIEDSTRKFVLLRLDDTPLPTLVNDLKYIDVRDAEVSRAVEQLMGFRGPADRIKAIQAFLEESDIQVDFVPGYGAIVGCPKCGAGLDTIRGRSAFDLERDDEYAWAECTRCGWTEGGEI
jgi:hypothetical protein